MLLSTGERPPDADAEALPRRDRTRSRHLRRKHGCSLEVAWFAIVRRSKRSSRDDRVCATERCRSRHSVWRPRATATSYRAIRRRAHQHPRGQHQSDSLFPATDRSPVSKADRPLSRKRSTVPGFP